MSIVWACCSSGRPEMLKAKTLTTLANSGFVGTLFVCVPHGEMATYTRALSEHFVILIGADKGLVNQRKHIRSMWPPGQEIVFIDDDISQIKMLMDGQTHPVQNIHALVDVFFQQIYHMEGPLMWGVYPITNKDCMKMQEAVGNCHIVGAFYGIINDARLVESDDDEMEDWARSLAEQKAGRSPVRFDWVGITTKYFKNDGGMQPVRTMEKRRQMCQSLCDTYADIVKLVLRKDGHADLKCLLKPTYVPRHVAVPAPEETTILAPAVAEGCEALTGGDL